MHSFSFFLDGWFAGFKGEKKLDARCKRFPERPKDPPAGNANRRTPTPVQRLARHGDLRGITPA
jgi:hypothetical protein